MIYSGAIIEIGSFEPVVVSTVSDDIYTVFDPSNLFLYQYPSSHILAGSPIRYIDPYRAACIGMKSHYGNNGYVRLHDRDVDLSSTYQYRVMEHYIRLADLPTMAKRYFIYHCLGDDWMEVLRNPHRLYMGAGAKIAIAMDMHDAAMCALRGMTEFFSYTDNDVRTVWELCNEAD